MKTEREQAQKNIAENRKAFHDYHILETFEAGVALLGTEVKSIREGNVNLRDSFARVEGGEIWIYNVHINPYSHRGYADHEPTRRRKLLLHRQEIRKLIGKTVEKGMTLVPTRMYFKNGHVKVALGAGQGQAGARQARDDQAARGGSRDARGGQGAQAVTAPGERGKLTRFRQSEAVTHERQSRRSSRSWSLAIVLLGGRLVAVPRGGSGPAGDRSARAVRPAREASPTAGPVRRVDVDLDGETRSARSDASRRLGHPHHLEGQGSRRRVAEGVAGG